MEIKQIFIDMDDVLNRFTMSALQHIGCPVNLYDESSFNPEWKFDIVRAANALSPPTCRPHARFTKESFWACFDRHFWANVAVSAECDWLIYACAEKVGEKNVCVLTTPIEDPDCLAGKLEWIQKYLPSWLHRQYAMSPCKKFGAFPGSLLIDDSDKNVDEFRAAGGSAILMPRPWNSSHAVSRAPAAWVRTEFRRVLR